MTMLDDADDLDDYCCDMHDMDVTATTAMSGPHDATTTTTTTQRHQVAPHLFVDLWENREVHAIAGKLWEAAPFLVRYLLRQWGAAAAATITQTTHTTQTTQTTTHSTHPPRNPTFVLELGAGTGFVGIALAKNFEATAAARGDGGDDAGSADGRGQPPPPPRCQVLLTDIAEAVPLMEENVRLNHLDRDKRRWATRTVVATLDWSRPATSDGFRILQESCENTNEYHPTNYNNNADTDVDTNNNTDNHHPVQYVVLLSDCVYWRHLHGMLLDTLTMVCRMLPRATAVYIAYRQRSMEKEQEFFLRLGAKFHMEIVEEDPEQMMYILRCTFRHELATTAAAADAAAPSSTAATADMSEQWWQLCLGRIDLE